MKQSLFKLTSFALLLYVVLFIMDTTVTNGLKKNTSNVFVDWNRIFSGDINSNLIVNGSSIAEVQISPKILDSVLKVDSYNLGMSGFSFLMQKARYDVFLQHNDTPEVIVQIVGDGTFTKKEGLFQLPQFLPYLDDTIIRSTVKQYKGLNFFDYNIPLFKYSGETETFVKGITSFFGYEFLQSDKYKGFFGNDFEWDYKFEKFKKENPNGKRLVISDIIKYSFESYVKSEKEKGVEIFIVFTPTYQELERYILNRNEIISIYESISNEYDVTFLDYSQSDFTKHKELFYNANHLNARGSDLFSKKLATDIKSRINGR